MSRSLILFEDERAGRFEPVALTRSVARLRLGVWTHRERWVRHFPDRTCSLVCRVYLERVEQESGEWAQVNAPPDGDTLFLAAALGRAPAVEQVVQSLESKDALVAGGRLVAARASGSVARELTAVLQEAAGEEPFPEGARDWPGMLSRAGFRLRDVDVEIPATLVDLVAENARAVEADFAELARESPAPDPAEFPGVHLVEPARIRIAEDVRIAPGAVLDASDGPIALGRETTVQAGCVLQGPLVTGRKCLFQPGARAGQGSSFGLVCKIGGEVHQSIVQGWSNKQHDGFLGHSYLGCWVNLGAATDTSDLKNDYGPVRVTLAREPVDTGRTSVGSLIGDHAKTAIHTRLNTGTVIGVSANVLAAGFPDRETPSFTWGGGEERAEYRLAKAVQVAAAVMGRRGRELGPADEALLARIHHATAERRRAWLEASRPRELEAQR